MSTPEERQWRSYMKGKEAARRHRVLSPSEKEEMLRKRAREQIRAMYDKYPMVAYVNLKPDDSIYSPKLKEHIDKSRQEMQARMQELKTAETKAMAEFKAKYPEMFEDAQEQEKQASLDSERFRRIYNEELEKLKTLPEVRKNPIKELVEYARFKTYVIRHFGLHHKVESIKFGPEDFGDWGKKQKQA